MMDDFTLYPREEPFDPFSVMLFKALQVVAFLFFIALLSMAPDAKEGKVDSKAEFIITMDWPDNHPDDLDLFVQDPIGNIAWYRHREAGFLTLDRDDRGGANDFIVVNGRKLPSPIREEIVTLRGVVAGTIRRILRAELGAQSRPSCHHRQLKPWRCRERASPHCPVARLASSTPGAAAMFRCQSRSSPGASRSAERLAFALVGRERAATNRSRQPPGDRRF